METSKDWKASFRVFIIGCGIGGLTAAIGCKRAGYSVTILEQAPELREVSSNADGNPAHRFRLAREYKSHPMLVTSFADGDYLRRLLVFP